MAIFGYVRKELLDEAIEMSIMQNEEAGRAEEFWRGVVLEWRALLCEKDDQITEQEGLLTTQSICIDKLTRERDFYASKYKAMTAGLAQNRKPKPKIGVWVAHNGGPNPVPGRKVVVRLAGDSKRGVHRTAAKSNWWADSEAESCNWQCSGEERICAYKVVE